MPKKFLLYLLFFIPSSTAFSQTEMGIENSDKIEQHESLNMLAIGYHIGGLTYIGAEYEMRFSRYVGFNLGAGVSGFTAGFKIHSCPCQTGPFLNISIKDGGFGDMGCVNCEIGGVLLPVSKNGKIGIMGQIGYSKIIYLTENYSEKLIKQGKSIESAISFGIGLSIYM